MTACLISYKRPKNIPKIVKHLMRYDFIDEVFIRDNSKCENIINLGRYRLGEKSESEWFYTQDDDCINHDLRKLYDEFMERKNDDGIWHGGNKIYIKQQREMIFGNSQSCMVGWGAFLKKEWIPLLDKYTRKYGHDYIFHRETDRILSILLERTHNPVLCEIEHLKGAKDEDIALCKEENHLGCREEAIKRALCVLAEKH